MVDAGLDVEHRDDDDLPTRVRVRLTVEAVANRDTALARLAQAQGIAGYESGDAAASSA